MIGRRLLVTAAVLAAAPLFGSSAVQAAADIRAKPAGEWRTVATDPYKGKRDDIHFANAKSGFYGTGAGDLFRTDDGGATWTKVWSQKGTFIRAIGFIDPKNGFIGNVGDYYPGVTDTNPLYRTRDGGRSWTPVKFSGGTIGGICAIDVLLTKSIYQGKLRDRAIIHAAGRVGGPAKLLRSVDGGETFKFIDLSNKAGMILDVKFIDANTGFVMAGSNGDIKESNALILKTKDGGKTWKEVYRSKRKLENSWKASFADAKTGYATVQTYDAAREQQVLVKTTNGGERWTEIPLIKDPKARQFGIGFASPQRGWVGTMSGGLETRDGGKSWTKVRLAPAANKIRVRAADGTKMIYAIGTEVQFNK